MERLLVGMNCMLLDVICMFFNGDLLKAQGVVGTVVVAIGPVPIVVVVVPTLISGFIIILCGLIFIVIKLM